MASFKPYDTPGLEAGLLHLHRANRYCRQQKKSQSGPVSRVLSPRMRAAAISLGERLLAPSSGLPEGHCRPDCRHARGRCLLFDLAPGGVCQASSVARTAGELLPHRFTLTAR